MILINRRDLPFIATQHYNEFFLKGGYLKKLEDIKNQTPSGPEKKFYTYLYDQIESVITGDPLKLEGLIDELCREHSFIIRRIAAYQALKKKHKRVEKRYKSILKSVKEAQITGPVPTPLKEKRDKFQLIHKKIDKALKEITLLIDRLNEVFNYDVFCSEYGFDNVTHSEKWGAYRMVKELKLNTCPYCNRNYITVAEPLKREEGRTRPELDHFYSQTKFPFLAVSFYNLVPCCHVCNSNLKRDKEFSVATHLHPYMQGFGDAVQFTVRFRNGNSILDYIRIWRGDVDLIAIDFKVNLIQKATMPRDKFKTLLRRINNNKRVFKLKTLYDSHRDIVGEIILKSVLYNDHKLQQLQRDFPLLFPTKEHVTHLLFSNYVESDKLDRRVLAKLTRDITKEFGIHHT